MSLKQGSFFRYKRIQRENNMIYSMSKTFMLYQSQDCFMQPEQLLELQANRKGKEIASCLLVLDAGNSNTCRMETHANIASPIPMGMWNIYFSALFMNINTDFTNQLNREYCLEKDREKAVVCPGCFIWSNGEDSGLAKVCWKCWETPARLSYSLVVCPNPQIKVLH